uniref:Ig-like domain-containing protein n=1 Tax=Cyprinus carpio carpio TaxID=630221 RepID=A0A9J7XSZ0_CYPCA
MSLVYSGLTEVTSVVNANPVTLRCDIQGGENIQLIYSLFKDGDPHDIHRTTEAEFSFTADVSDSGVYSCRGERSDTSAAVTLTVSVKAEVKVTPDQRVFRGETVTLTCDIQGGGNIQWTYNWFKDASVIPDITERVYTITSLSNNNKYSCEATRSDINSVVTLTVSDLPTSTLTVTPDSPVFTGERVNLKCEIISDHSDWRYEWYKGRDTVISQTSERYTVNTDTLTIRGATESDQGQFWCRGQRDKRPKSSQSSSAVSLTVKDLPTSTLTVTPDSPVFTGERVSLKCVINSDHSDWRYEWNKGSVMLQTSERYTVNTDTLTITAVTTSDAGQFWCRGQRDERPKSSQSSSVSLTVTDLPTSTLTVTPDSPVFTGERVILTCVINSDHSNWRYEWNKGSVMLQTSERYTVNTDTLTIRGATESDAGQFWCRGQRDERPNSSQSSSVSLTVKDLPTSTLTVTPDNPVFTGERVDLKCMIESHSDWRQRNGLTYDRGYDWTYYQTAEWRYEWYKGSVMLQTSERYTVNTDTLTIRAVTTSDAGQFWCRGEREKRPNSSQSSSVSLTVKDSPTSTLTVTPYSPVFTGERVILKCVIESHSNWRYVWYKGSVMLQSSERYTVNTDTLTIRGATESDQDQFWCRGQRDERPNSSQSSSAVPVTVKGVSPSVSLVVRPSRSQHFSSDSLSLSCEDQRNSAGWTVRRYTDRNTEDCSKLSGSTCRLVSLSTSDAGVYWCQSESGEKSHRLKISVHDGDVILESSVDPVIEGHTLTLHCLHRSTNSPILRADFYKDGSLVQNQTTGEMIITTVSKSHEGFYYCKTERGQSLHSWISVREKKENHADLEQHGEKEENHADLEQHLVSRSGQISVYNILSFLLAACPYLLATVVLLYKYYRARVPSTEDQSQYAVTEEET